MAAERSSLRRDEPGSVPATGSRSAVEPGRLGVYAGIGAAIGAVPLPWLPDALVRRVRGAVVHDVAVRHGVSLSMEARDVLSEPAGPDGPRGLLAQTLRFVGMRFATRAFNRLRPARMLWPARNALETYVLGHLFDRYLDLERTERAVRIDATEARRIRQAVDGALARAITVEPPPAQEPTVIDDQRDAVTAFVDGLLGIVAGLPHRLTGRLDAAFDDLLAHGDG
ncbi:MAG TPA: hypothetical protein VGG39_31500 [Polyangiaceae bacterium]|jgi:hypothetical protein